MSDEKTVLVVDDEPDAIKFVSAVLSGIGDFNILTATDGNTSLDKVRTGNPDLVILDIMMPERDGFQVFYELRQQETTRDIPVIILTGVSDKSGIKFFKSDMGEYMGSEPFDYLEKPLDPSQLEDSVKRALSNN